MFAIKKYCDMIIYLEGENMILLEKFKNLDMDKSLIGLEKGDPVGI
ncbi:MAG: hypothetical protein J6J15_02390 [Oscillospiraceae bacterium]|nr:hypothetical protein [Oscillospiraceae bacterium]